MTPPPSTSLLDMTVKHVMLRLKSLSFGECEVLLNCHYSQVHSDPEWSHLIYIKVVRICLRQGLSNARSKNYFSVARGRKFFVTNIFLKLVNLSLAPDHVPSQRSRKCTLIFQSLSLQLSLQNAKLKNRYNSIPYT